MEVYMDNSATTKPYDEVARVVYDTMLNNYGNPSSLHRMGKNAEDLLTKCRETIADTICAASDEVYFTSGGTESDNLAIIGYALANRRRGKKIITQRTEHKAVLEAFDYLEKQGFDVCRLGVDSDGMINLEELRSELNDDTILVSIMAVNNETGAIMPVEKISALIDHSKCAFHVDAVQAYGKMKINVKRLGIDLLTMSAHKIHGPNGVGALYIRKGVRVQPIIMGGQQERTIRSGTENLAGIAGFAKAAQIKFAAAEREEKYVSALKEKLVSKLGQIPGAIINSPSNSLYCLVNVSFVGVRSEVLLHVLESNGIYVSAGSACNSHKNKFSYVLSEMNIGSQRIDSALRFSLSEFNTDKEIEYTAQVLSKEVPVLQKIMR